MTVSSTSENTRENKIPSWVKNNTGLWDNGTISDDDFVSGIRYLVNSGIVVVHSILTQIESNVNSTNNSNQQCDKYDAGAEKETCLEQLEYDKN